MNNWRILQGNNALSFKKSKNKGELLKMRSKKQIMMIMKIQLLIQPMT